MGSNAKHQSQFLDPGCHLKYLTFFLPLPLITPDIINHLIKTQGIFLIVEVQAGVFDRQEEFKRGRRLFSYRN